MKPQSQSITKEMSVLFPLKLTCCFALLTFVALPFKGFPQAAAATPNGVQAQGRQAYSGTFWTTILQPVGKGSTQTFTQRVLVSQDAQGKWKKTYYRITRGAQYDVSAPVDHTDSGVVASTQASLYPSVSNGEILERDENLGTRSQDGLVLQGRRRTFESVGRKPAATHVLEHWYSPVLGAIVHSESHNFNGVVITTDLKDLHLGSADLPNQSGEVPVAPQQATSEPRLYRGLFSIVAHMERARLADPPRQVGNVAVVEDAMRRKIGLSQTQWQALVTSAVKVDAYTEEIDKQARDLARAGRAKSGQSLDAASRLDAVRRGLNAMQMDRDTRVHDDIQKLEAVLGAENTTKLHAFLNGPLTDSAHTVHLKIRSEVAR